MKRTFQVFALLVSSVFGQLPEMSEGKEWLAYFVGWEERNFDFGVGADAEMVMMIKDDRKRVPHKTFPIRQFLQEDFNGKAVYRKLAEENPHTSEDEKGLNPKGPVTLVTTYGGETQVEWTFLMDGGEMVIRPRIVGQKTKNPVRVGLQLWMPKMYYLDDDVSERELKKLVGKDTLEGVRVKDGKKVRLKFHETDEDVNGEEYFQEGASEIEVKAKGLEDRTLVMKQGSPKAGKIMIEAEKEIYHPFKLIWWPDPAELGKEGCVLRVSVE
ncbi:MAG: hypothetical protein ACSHYF_13850 [Verrucomicrobiaceae bacterium]